MKNFTNVPKNLHCLKMLIISILHLKNTKNWLKKIKPKKKEIPFIYMLPTKKNNIHISNKQKNKGYDVLIFDGQLDLHFINYLEQKLTKTSFKRIDAETIDKLIEKEEQRKVEMSESDQNDLRHVFFGALPNKEEFLISYEALNENDLPLVITRSEYMRRMKDMSQFSPKSMYGGIPDMYSMVVNTSHSIIKKIVSEKEEQLSEDLQKLDKKLNPFKLKLIN